MSDQTAENSDEVRRRRQRNSNAANEYLRQPRAMILPGTHVSRVGGGDMAQEIEMKVGRIDLTGQEMYEAFVHPIGYENPEADLGIGVFESIERAEAAFDRWQRRSGKREQLPNTRGWLLRTRRIVVNEETGFRDWLAERRGELIAKHPILGTYAPDVETLMRLAYEAGCQDQREIDRAED